MVNIPTEAPAQLRHDLQDKDLDVPHEDKELDNGRVLPLWVIGKARANMKMLWDLKLDTASWLAMMQKPKYVTVPGRRSVLHREIEDFWDSLTELYSIVDEAPAQHIWTKGELKSFDCHCKLMRDKWQTVKVKCHQFKQFKDDEEEDRKPVVVENDETPKKRSKVN